MKKIYTALLLVLLTAMFSVGVYSLADYDATGSASEKREFIKPEFSVKALLDGTYIPALERYYSDTPNMWMRRDLGGIHNVAASDLGRIRIGRIAGIGLRHRHPQGRCRNGAFL